MPKTRSTAPATNTLYYGDNLDILRAYIADESVDLVYLDPPFNSNATYNVLFKSRADRRAEPGADRGAGAVKVREVIRLIEADGWFVIATRGSHRQYKHPTKPGRITIAGKPSDDLAPGTLTSILK